MPPLRIVTGEKSPILRTETKKVPKVTKEIQKLLRDMQDTVLSADGLGIAGPQVNSEWRVCIARLNDRLIPMVNPEITWKSDVMDVKEEGCLSLPKVWVNVPRPIGIKVKFLDEKGREQERALEHIDARVVQHEVDHLHGKLIIDYAEKGKPM